MLRKGSQQQYQKEDNNFLRKMNHAKPKVQFRPRKISASKSKQKYSPYRNKQKKGDCDEYLLENRQRIALNEPIIRFRRLIEFNSSKSKLKIGHEDRKTSPRPTTQTAINNNEDASTSARSCHNCELLLRKIEEQTVLLQQNLKEINNTLKLPKLGKSESEGPRTLDYEKYAENQKVIMEYLDEIKNRRDETVHLRQAQDRLEEEVQALRRELGEWQMKGKELEVELGVAKALLAESKPLQDAATSSPSVAEQEPKAQQLDQAYKDEMKAIMTEIMERHSFDFQKIMSELQQIKLENDMLREEVKLLNYAMNQKDAKINVLKNELVGFIQATKRSHRNSSAKSAKSSLKQSKKSKKVAMKSMEVSIECIEYSDNRDSNLTQKRSSSILVTSNYNHVAERAKPDGSEGERRSEQSESNYQNVKRGRTMPVSHLANLARRGSVGEEDKLTMAKPFLKLSKKESVITKHEKQQLEREKKELMYFSEGKLRDLDLIRRTLQRRFKGFKFTFQQLQTQMLARQDDQIPYEQMDGILTEYPFSLEQRLRQAALEYILREGATGKAAIANDLFCNRLRELLVDYEDVEEQEELLVVEKLKKKIYMYLEAILNECSEVEDRRGLVSEANLQRVLEQFKLSTLETEMFVNQCSLLSADADHLDYKQYLSIFQNDQ